MWETIKSATTEPSTRFLSSIYRIEKWLTVWELVDLVCFSKLWAGFAWTMLSMIGNLHLGPDPWKPRFLGAGHSLQIHAWFSNGIFLGALDTMFRPCVEDKAGPRTGPRLLSYGGASRKGDRVHLWQTATRMRDKAIILGRPIPMLDGRRWVWLSPCGVLPGNTSPCTGMQSHAGAGWKDPGALEEKIYTRCPHAPPAARPEVPDTRLRSASLANLGFRVNIFQICVKYSHCCF